MANKKEEETPAKEGLRVSLLIVGIFGLLYNIVKTIILVPTLSYGLAALFSTDVPDAGLLITAGVLLAVLLVLSTVLGFIVFGKCVAYFFTRNRAGKGFIATIITGVVLIFGMFVGSCVTASIWTQRNGGTLYDVYQSILQGVDIDVTDCDSKKDGKCDVVQIKDGHVKVQSGSTHFEF